MREIDSRKIEIESKCLAGKAMLAEEKIKIN